MLRYMTDEDRYLFDLRGYLIVRQALHASELRSINALIDERAPAAMRAHLTYAQTGFPTGHPGLNDDPKLGPIDVHSGLLLEWGEAVRRLVGHEATLGYLIDLLGDTLRFDHAYALF